MCRFAGVAALALFAAAALAFDVPPNDGFVTQTTPVVTPAEEAELERILGEEERTTSNEIAILLTDTLGGEPIAEVSNRVFREWGVGKADRNNGILILVAAADQEVNIETGYGLEGAVPDLVAKGVIEEDMIPHFREGRYGQGLLLGVESLRKHVAGEYTAERYESDEGPSGVQMLLFFLFVGVQAFGSIMARTKSWWLGGVLGGIAGVVLTVLYSWWVAIPFLVLLGLGLDYVLSKAGPSRRRGGMWFGGPGGFGGGGGGGFGGFGGGSAGGGGARGRW